MSTDSTLPPNVQIRQVRLFYSGADQVAVYGAPSTYHDGWIANLPARDVFAGDQSGLLYEVLIDALEAHSRTPFQTQFYEQHVRRAPLPSWQENATNTPAKSSPDLSQQSLRNFQAASTIALRLAQQAKAENNLRDHQRLLVSSAAAALQAASLQSDADKATTLRAQALGRFTAAANAGVALAREARNNDNLRDRQHFLQSAAEAALEAASLQGDSGKATTLRTQALQRFTAAASAAVALARQAGNDDNLSDRQMFLQAGAESALRAAELETDATKATTLRSQALARFSAAANAGMVVARNAREKNNMRDHRRFLHASAEAALKAAALENDSAKASTLRSQALARFTSAANVAMSLARAARAEDDLIYRQRCLQASAAAALQAASLQSDDDKAATLRTQADQRFRAAANAAVALAREAHADNNMLAQQRHLLAAGYAGQQLSTASEE